MIAAIMQPYFFPYIGYFQLMRAVDTFVFYDDAQYMKGGWINRNRILHNGEPAWLTLPVRRASLTLAINQRDYLFDGEAICSLKKRLHDCYQKAPEFDSAFPFVCDLLEFGNPNVAAFNAHVLEGVARYLGLGCRFLASSAIEKPAGLKGQAKVIEICKRLGASRYVNPSGGVDLYTRGEFACAGIELQFLEAKPASYKQFDAAHQPFLSIIDVLMFNSIERIQTLLDDFRLIQPARTNIQ